MSRTLLLIVDDVLEHRRQAAAFFKREGYEVLEAESVAQGVEAAHLFPELRLVISDVQLKDRGTVRQLHLLVATMLAERSGMFVVVTTSRTDVLPGKLQREYLEANGVPILLRGPGVWEKALAFLTEAPAMA